ncbi:MAG: diaminopimelate decarboxylase [Pseudomonadota bacterium]
MICEYLNNELHIENVSLASIAREYGTPVYVYSKGKITDNFSSYQRAFGDRDHAICYAVKANSNIAILKLLHDLGAGFDVVSIGELERVHAAGAASSETVFAGVGKMAREIERALALNIGCFNVESVDELSLIDQIAGKLGSRARIAVRVNPDVDPKTHPYISTGLNENKFGIPMPNALEVYLKAQKMAHIEIAGVACHIGSQLTEIAPFVAAAERVQGLINQLDEREIKINQVDIGGGLGISYGQENPPAIEEYVTALCKTIDPSLRIAIEPGRSIVGDAGLLLTQVLYMKQTPAKHFAIVDASMSELIRPALYQAHHPVMPVSLYPSRETQLVDIVGPVCETADFLAKGRELALGADDFIAIMDAGAYSAVMASSYNTRPKPAELIVSADQSYLIRERDSIESLIANERIVDF